MRTWTDEPGWLCARKLLLFERITRYLCMTIPKKKFCHGHRRKPHHREARATPAACTPRSRPGAPTPTSRASSTATCRRCTSPARNRAPSWSRLLLLLAGGGRFLLSDGVSSTRGRHPSPTQGPRAPVGHGPGQSNAPAPLPHLPEEIWLAVCCFLRSADFMPEGARHRWARAPQVAAPGVCVVVRRLLRPK